MSAVHTDSRILIVVRTHKHDLSCHVSCLTYKIRLDLYLYKIRLYLCNLLSVQVSDIITLHLC